MIYMYVCIFIFHTHMQMLKDAGIPKDKMVWAEERTRQFQFTKDEGLRPNNMDPSGFNFAENALDDECDTIHYEKR